MSQWSSDVFTPVLSLLRQAFAATPEGARALARSQSAPAASEDAALRRLPVAALRLEPEAEMALRRAGLKSIGDLAARPATPLAARFGEDAPNMLALVLGLTDKLGRASCTERGCLYGSIPEVAVSLKKKKEQDKQ